MNIKNIIVLIAVTQTIALLARSQNVDDARQLIENERYSSAEALLEKSIGNTEVEPEISYLLVKTYLEQEKTEEAKKFVDKHLQSALSDKVDPLNRIAAARYLLNAGNMKAVEEIFSSIFNNRKNQKDPLLLIAMAEVSIDEKEGDTKAALMWLDKAEKRDRHNPKIDIARGLAYRKLNDASNAYLSYQKAIQKDPQNPRAYYLMGKIFTAQKNPEVYMGQFRKAYEIDSTYAPVLEELYKYYYYRDIKMAKKYLEKFVANTDYSLQNDYYMTDIFYLNGEYQHAIEAAGEIIAKDTLSVQPRLYKLIAYSYAKSGDSIQALKYINSYFDKEDPAKVIAADFQLIAQLTGKVPGQEEAAITYYSIAVDMDTITANKADYAAAIAEIYKRTGNNSKQAEWLGKLYGWREKTNNLDLFNWGLARYNAKEYLPADSVFSIYTTRYSDDIYGYYWRAQANAAIDTSMQMGFAIPYYNKVVEIGERNKEKSVKMLLKAYGYLGGYEANITKDFEKSLTWFEKYLDIDNENTDVKGYVEVLKKWIAQKR